MSFSTLLHRLVGGTKLACPGPLGKSLANGSIRVHMHTMPRVAVPWPTNNARFFSSSSALFNKAGPRTSRMKPEPKDAEKRANQSRPSTQNRPSSQSRPSAQSRPAETLQRLSILDKIPTNVVFWGILGLNGLVFLMWGAAKQDRNQAAFMIRNFTASWENTFARPWTLITAAFSHMSFSHILFNGLGFYFFAKDILIMLGTRRFLGLYLGAAAISNFAAAAWEKNGPVNFSLGASGAIFSIMALLACVAPTTSFLIYGLIPVPAFVAVPGMFSWDLYWGLKRDKDDSISRVGHVTGILTGVAYYLGKRYRVF